MDHQKPAGKPMSKILKFLPRATSSVTFQSPPLYSPSKDKRPSEKPHKSNLGIGFSGPMVSIAPSDNRRKLKIDDDSTYALVYEPTSPRVSCMGQVKCKHYRKFSAAAAVAAAKAADKPTKKHSRTTSVIPVTASNRDDDQVVTKSKKKSGIRSLFRGGGSGSRRKSDATEGKSTTALGLPRAPSLGKMKRFASGRDAFASFDWTTQVTPLDCEHRNYLTDDGGSDGEEIVMPSSAPVMERNKGIGDNFVRVAGLNLEPRKEVNLWKRRTMSRPQPLQLHGVN